MTDSDVRRRLLGGLAAALTFPAQASGLRALAPMTDGPYYPHKRAPQRAASQQADLTHVTSAGRTLTALGEHLSLTLAVVDRAGRPLGGAAVEIWQCDSLTSYHHHDVPLVKGQYDEGFAGYGAAISGADGAVQFRTIRPVPYAGNSPHIHLKVRHGAFGVLTSRLWIDGDPGNARDYNWVQTEPDDRPGLAFRLHSAPAQADVRWMAQHTLVMPV